jgi:hypothetical protein
LEILNSISLFIAIIVNAICEKEKADTQYYPNNHIKKEDGQSGTTTEISSNSDKQIGREKHQGKQYSCIQK